VTTRKEIKEVVRRLRATVEYESWVQRNLATNCLSCNATEQLQVHHIVELRYVVTGLWRLYGDWTAVFEHAASMHTDDRCEGVTLCEECHNKLHPGRSTVSMARRPLQVATWTVTPRTLSLPFRAARKGHSDASVGLIGFQTLFGFGWYILNGHLDVGPRMLEFNRRRFAELLGKRPGSSFNDSFETALRQLHNAGVILGHAIITNDVEVHLSPDYLRALADNPWFIPLNEVATSRMLTLLLRWHLSFQGGRNTYRISGEKLAQHLHIETHTPAWWEHAVTTATEGIPWAIVSWRKGIAQFKLTKRGAVPIHSLRSMLTACLTD
jgi:hypothetical protein